MVFEGMPVFNINSALAMTNYDNSRITGGALWKKLWKIRVPERLRMLLWRIGPDAIPTKDNMIKRFESIDPTCPLCCQDIESTCHVFFNCPVAKAIWLTSCWGFRASDHQISSCEDIINLVVEPPKAPCPIEDLWKITLNIAIILDEIWQPGSFSR